MSFRIRNERLVVFETSVRKCDDRSSFPVKLLTICLADSMDSKTGKKKKSKAKKKSDKSKQPSAPEEPLSTNFFAPDLTLGQLREALTQRGIESKMCKIGKSGSCDCNKRWPKSNNKSASSAFNRPMQASSSSNLPPCLYRRNRQLSKEAAFIASQTTANLSQYLQFSEVGALARCCQVLRATCTLKLQGHPSHALARRHAVGSLPGTSNASHKQVA